MFNIMSIRKKFNKPDYKFKKLKELFLFSLEPRKLMKYFLSNPKCQRREKPANIEEYNMGKLEREWEGHTQTELSNPQK